MELRAVGFDIDGTVYSNLRMYLHSLPWAAANAGLLRALNHARAELRAMGKVEDFHDVQAALTAQHLGCRPAEAKKLIEDKIYGEWEDRLRGLPLVRGFLHCVEELRKRGLKLGLLSDFPVGKKLDILGLGKNWDCVLSTESLGYLKPGAAGFLRLCSDFQLEPEHVLYVGNSFSHDIIGARAVGLRTAHFTRRRKRNQVVADLSFHSYHQLLDWILSKY